MSQFLTAGKEKEPGTNTALLVGLRYSYLGGVSVHVMTCVWYAIACYNEAMGRGECMEGTWTKHTGVCSWKYSTVRVESRHVTDEWLLAVTNKAK